MKIINIIILKSFLLFAINCFSQSTITESIFNSVASPTVQDLGKYGDIPMNLYTGRANVTIPIYNTNQLGVALNISMSYDTGGMLLSQLPSWTGHGWTLNAGGCITRKLQGYYDEDENKVRDVSRHLHIENLVNYFKNNKTVDDKTDEEIADDVTNAHCVYDYSPDVFIFNFMGKNGRFFLDKDKKWRVQCDENIKVEFDVNDQSNYILPFIPTYAGTQTKMSKTIKGFTLIDENGIRYKFGGTTDAIEYSIGFFEQDVEDWRANSWYLTEVQDRFGNVLYKFNYKRGKFLLQIINNLVMSCTNYVFSHEYYSGSFWKTLASAFLSRASLHSMSSGTNVYFPFLLTLNAPVYLKSISTLDKTNIDFSLSKDICIPETEFYPSFDKYCQKRVDFLVGTPYNKDTPYILNVQEYGYASTNVNNNAYYLCYLRNHLGAAKEYTQYWDEKACATVLSTFPHNTSMESGKGFDNPLSVLSFNPLESIDISSYQNQANPKRIKFVDFVYSRQNRLHITAINTYGNNGKSANGLLYSYKMEYKDYDKIPKDYLCDEFDYWGYYNKDSENNYANPVTTQYGMLSNLIYPTGGYSEFTYEQNCYSQVVNDNGYMYPFWKNELAGGLRISKIKNYTSKDELFNEKSYSYNNIGYDDDLSSGQCYRYPRNQKCESYRYRVPGRGFASKDIYYTYRKASAVPLTDSYGPHIGYSWVTETVGNIKKEYHYTNYSDYPEERPVRIANESYEDKNLTAPFVKFTELGFCRGKLQREYIYENGIVKYGCEYKYNLDRKKNVLTTTFARVPDDHVENGFLVGCIYKLYFCNLELSEKSEITSADNGYIIKDVTEYKMEDWYPNKNDRSFSLRKLMSEKNTRWAKNKPFDSQEKQYHYLASELSDYFFPLTSINTFRNGQEVKRESFIYGYDASGITSNQKILTKETYAQYPDFKERTKVTYDLYDKNGQLLQFTEPGKGTTYLTWNNGKLIKTARGSADSHITTYGYTPDGLLNRTTTPNGYVTNYNYDSFGRLGEVSDSNGILQKYDYNLKNK